MIYRADPSDIQKSQPEKVVEKYFVPAETTTPTNGSQPAIQNLTLILVLISIIAALALGISIANMSKEKHKKED